MSYKEWEDSGNLYKCYRNDAGLLHRYDGPSIICCHPDGSIYAEQFYIDGEFLGVYKQGFWALWEKLTDSGAASTGSLKVFDEVFLNYRMINGFI